MRRLLGVTPDDEGLRIELLRRLNEIPGVAFPPDAITRRRSIQLAYLAAEHAALRQFEEVLAWVLQTARDSQALPPATTA